MDKEVAFGSSFPTHTTVLGEIIGKHGFSFFVEMARTAERLGYRSFLIPDHHMFPLPGNNVLFETWTVLSALAVLTREIRLGTCVTPVPFYHPGNLAKRVACVDQISGGRVVLGVGSGWVLEEFAAYGIPFESHSVRTQKTSEGIQIIKGLWTNDGPLTFHGKYYTLEKAMSLPKPVQKPHPPIWLGGESTKIIEVVANLGDGWIPAAMRMTPETYRSRVDLLRRLLQKIGREPDDVTCALTIRAPRARSKEEMEKQQKSSLMVHDEGERTPRTASECVASIQRYMAAGARHVVIGIEPTTDLEAMLHKLRLCSEEIIPKI